MYKQSPRALQRIEIAELIQAQTNTKLDIEYLHRIQTGQKTSSLLLFKVKNQDQVKHIQELKIPLTFKDQETSDYKCPFLSNSHK